MKMAIATSLALIFTADLSSVTNQVADGVVSHGGVTEADIAKCNRNAATLMAYSAVLSHFESLHGSCVAVEGYWHGRALYMRARDARFHGSNDNRKLRGRRIGLYAPDGLQGIKSAEPKRHLVVGVISDCESQWPDALFITGYCHYTDGPIIFVSEVTSL